MAEKRSGGNLFIHPSTRNFFLEGRKVPGYRLIDFLHGYVYGRWIYLYIALGKGDHLLARIFSPLFKLALSNRRGFRPSNSHPPGNDQATNTVADGYHGKVVTTSQARRLVRLDRPLHIPDLEQVIPYVRARALILQHPNDLAVLDCPCRAAQPTHCLPLAVCLVVGKVFVDFMLAHHPKKARRLSQAEAEEILAAEARRGLDYLRRAEVAADATVGPCLAREKRKASHTLPSAGHRLCRFCRGWQGEMGCGWIVPRKRRWGATLSAWPMTCSVSR